MLEELAKQQETQQATQLKEFKHKQKEDLKAQKELWRNMDKRAAKVR